jgi:hypothetical protein
MGFSPAWHTEAGLGTGCDDKYNFMYIPGIGIVCGTQSMWSLMSMTHCVSYPLKPHYHGSSYVLDLSSS